MTQEEAEVLRQLKSIDSLTRFDLESKRDADIIRLLLARGYIKHVGALNVGGYQVTDEGILALAEYDKQKEYDDAKQRADADIERSHSRHEWAIAVFTAIATIAAPIIVLIISHFLD